MRNVKVRNSVKNGLEMMDKILDKTKTREGEPIYFTEKEWKWVTNIFLDIKGGASPYYPWVDGEYNMTNPTHILWLDSYNKYLDIIDREKKGFRFPCGCRAGYECKFGYVKIRDGDCKIYKRYTGNIHDDQECIDELLENEPEDVRGTCEWIYGRCPVCLVSYGQVHHVNCSYERCPICLDQPRDCDEHVVYERCAIPMTGVDDNHICYSHQFIICIHNSNVRYYEEPIDDDGVFEAGFNYRLTNAKDSGR